MSKTANLKYIGGSKDQCEAIMSVPDLEIFRLIVDQAPDAIIVADPEGSILVWNQAACEIFGHSAQEAMGKNLDLIIPEHLRRAHWEGYGKAVISGTTKYGRRAIKTRAVHKDGHKLYVSLAFAIIKDQEGKVIGAMATAREFIAEPARTSGPRSSEKEHRDDPA